METRPSDFPPPVQKGEFIAAPQASGDDVIEVGVLFIGGGPAGLAGAIRLAKELQDKPEVLEALGEVPIAVIDKGMSLGSHQLSGAVVNPGPLKELFPDLPLEKMTSYGEVTKEAVYMMTPSKALKIPTPPPFHNKGNHVFSLSRLARWMSEQAEELGVMLLPETTAEKLLVSDGRVVGVKTGDKGRGKEGEELANFEPGMELHAGMTVLSEGTQGHLSLAAIEEFSLAPESAQVWALGVKEIWKVAKPLDKIIHTLGWPLRKPAKYHEFGGSWMYPMGDDHVSIGFVLGLDWHDAAMSGHDLLQEFKTHPMIKDLLEGGERVSWGAKTIPEGGWLAMPTKLAVPGAMLVGDTAGLVNVAKLKGVHYAIKSGMLAADAVIEHLNGGGTLADAPALTSYDSSVRDGQIGKDLYEVRNAKQVFAKGFYVGGFLANLITMTKGKFPGKNRLNVPDAEHPLFNSGRTFPAPDGKLTFDKLSSVFISGNKTRDDQPNHIRIQENVPKLVAESWVNMCPAAVYEIDEEATSGDTVTVKMAPSNCIHCGAITAKGGRLTPPEGGSGPEYQLL